MHRLKGKSCPGEAVCTTDRKNGEIAGVRGRSQGYTLKNHCHDKEATPTNGLKENCPFFDTKPENVPQKLLGAIQVAEEFKELKMLGMLPSLETITAFEYVCFRAAEYASNTIEAETIEEMNNSASSTPGSAEKFGSSTAIPSSSTEDSPFDNWEK